MFSTVYPRSRVIKENKTIMDILHSYYYRSLYTTYGLLTGQPDQFAKRVYQIYLPKQSIGFLSLLPKIAITARIHRALSTKRKKFPESVKEGPRIIGHKEVKDNK